MLSFELEAESVRTNSLVQSRTVFTEGTAKGKCVETPAVDDTIDISFHITSKPYRGSDNISALYCTLGDPEPHMKLLRLRSRANARITSTEAKLCNAEFCNPSDTDIVQKKILATRACHCLQDSGICNVLFHYFFMPR